MPVTHFPPMKSFAAAGIGVFAIMGLCAPDHIQIEGVDAGRVQLEPPPRPPGLRVCSNEGGTFRKECPAGKACLDGFALQRRDKLRIPYGCYKLCDDLDCPRETRCQAVSVELEVAGKSVLEVHVCLPVEPPVLPQRTAPESPSPKSPKP